jgi:hypothetical protein
MKPAHREYKPGRGAGNRVLAFMHTVYLDAPITQKLLKTLLSEQTFSHQNTSSTGEWVDIRSLGIGTERS